MLKCVLIWHKWLFSACHYLDYAVHTSMVLKHYLLLFGLCIRNYDYELCFAFMQFSQCFWTRILLWNHLLICFLVMCKNKCPLRSPWLSKTCVMYRYIFMITDHYHKFDNFTLLGLVPCLRYVRGIFCLGLK